MLPARYRYLLYLCLAAVNTALVLVVSGSPACLPGPSAFIYGTTHRPSIAPRTASHTHQLRVEFFVRLYWRGIYRRAPVSLTRDRARSSTATASSILTHVCSAVSRVVATADRRLKPLPERVNNVQGAALRAMNAPALRPSPSESRISCATSYSCL